MEDQVKYISLTIFRNSKMPANILKGFVTIGNLIKNDPNTLSPIGEISTQSLTYSKEKGEYNHTDYPDLKLITFSSYDLSNTKIVVDDKIVHEVLKVIYTLIKTADPLIIPFTTLDLHNLLLVALAADELHDLTLGSLVNGVIGTSNNIALPEWISWTSTADPKTSVKIWLSDAAFADQYDEFEIVVIPPLEPIDDMLGKNYNNIVTKLQARALSQLTDKIFELKMDKPETFLRGLEFKFYNALDTTQSVPSSWTVLIYGKAGDNIDSIKDAIMEYVLAHSAGNEDSWKLILPELFKRTEFLIIPRWDITSVVGISQLDELYGSIVDITTCSDIALKAATNYPQSHTLSNTYVMPHDYKCLTLVTVNGVDNIEGKRKLTDMFKDYLPINTSSLDFNRMTVKTKEWLVLLETLLQAAETATMYNTISSKLRRIRRGPVDDKILFITAVYDGVNYLVASKTNKNLYPNVNL